MQNPIHCVIGLGNPGPKYEGTRHNVGAWCVAELATEHHAPLRLESKFSAQLGSFRLQNHTIQLALPTTFMNHSGKAVRAIAQFYRLTAPQILVIHDDLDLPVGTARLKIGGGDGGHNGLKDITAALQTNAYLRLRIGIGHPGHRDQVHDYVLTPPSKAEKEQLLAAISQAEKVFPLLFDGKIEQAMTQLHTER
jgi:PTH1 family peptidyl-tRNA hydrolase